MRIPFTKMQGAGNDFVVLNETAARFNLTPAQYRWLANRHFGVGADQILSVRPAPDERVDFAYVIHNADGSEVEHCGNGARCFMRYVHEKGLSTRNPLRVQVKNGQIDLHLRPGGHVSVNMGAPVFDPARVPFDPSGLSADVSAGLARWPLPLNGLAGHLPQENHTASIAVLSMGNPHAVLLVDDVQAAPVLTQGPLIEQHARFAQRVNVGFLQIVGRNYARLRVYERGAGETLACGTGACAAVVVGIRLGLLDAQVQVQTQGGTLTIEWHDSPGHDHPVWMSGPAVCVFEGVVDLPDQL